MQDQKPNHNSSAFGIKGMDHGLGDGLGKDSVKFFGHANLLIGVGAYKLCFPLEGIEQNQDRFLCRLMSNKLPEDLSLMDCIELVKSREAARVPISVQLTYLDERAPAVISDVRLDDYYTDRLGAYLIFTLLEGGRDLDDALQVLSRSNQI